MCLQWLHAMPSTNCAYHLPIAPTIYQLRLPSINCAQHLPIAPAIYTELFK
jgi:hypothetical protein